MSRPLDTGEELESPTATSARDRGRAVAAPTAGVPAAPPDDVTPATEVEPLVPRRAPAPALTVAGRVDRFLILEKLGEGGMGAVYAAYDTLLDRKVAMKVVRPDRRGVSGVSPRERLVREAQAMARLSHPNVVAVLEVGELGDDVYLALELVEGATLKAWLRARPRSWREILAVFLAAGRGLAAAHAAGLVHRDVKPDNLLIGDDGRVRVADFGVASMSHGQHESTPGASGEREADGSDAWSGMRVGTPAYMAPEQHDGAPVDGRADQFAFCVALWEALYGERPFAPVASGGSVRDRPLRPPPAGAAIPAWIEPLLRRGLAAEPAARWPSMEALLAELGRDRALARRRGFALASVGLALFASLTLAVVGWTRDRAAAARPCQGEERHLARVWDAPRAGALVAALRATGAPGAADAAARVRAHLDDWTGRWVVARTDACAATRIHGDQSEALLDARMRCLDRRLARVDALIAALVQIERDGVSRAIEIASDLPSLDACADRDQLTAIAGPPADPETRQRVTALEHELARVTAVERTGRYPEALALLVPVVAAAIATEHAPLVAETLAVRGRLEAQTGEAAAAAATLREAAILAAGAGADDIAADALVDLVWALSDQGKGGDAVALAAGAAAAAARVHDGGRAAALASHVGGAHATAGDLGAAALELERALGLAEAALGEEHVRVAQILNRLGNVEEARGRVAEARAAYARALAIAEVELGVDHPSTAVTRANLCYLDARQGQLGPARACQTRVVASLEAALGPRHPKVAWALNDLGLLDQEEGDLTAARDRFERALAIWEGVSSGGAGAAAHPDVAWPLVNLADLAMRRGEPAAAEPLCRRALAAVEAAHGLEHPDAMHPLACLGNALADRRPAEARPHLERALALATAAGDALATGAIHFALARGALATRARPAAGTHARTALAAYAAAGATAAQSAAEVEAWLARHRL